MRWGPTLLLAVLAVGLLPPAAPQGGGLAIASVQTIGDGGGHLHGLLVRLSQPAETVAVDVAHFQVTGCACPNLRLARGPDPTADLLLWFDPSDSSATLPGVRYVAPDAARIRMGGALLPDDAAPHAASDGAAPAVAGYAYTNDAGTGDVNGVDVTFSEPVKDASLALSGWTLAGAAPTGWATGAAANDARVHLAFAPTSAWPAGSAPRLVAALGAATDLAGNALSPFDSAPPAPAGTSPVRLASAVVAGFARNEVKLTFTGPVVPTEDARSQLFTSDLAYLDRAAGGASGIAAVTAASGATTATLTLNAPFAYADEGVDAIQVREGTLKDGNGALLPAHSVPLRVDRAPPVQASLAPTAAAASAHAVHLAWTTPDADVAYVEVRRSPSAITLDTLAAAPLVQRATGTALDVTGLPPQSEQHFAFQAVDLAGNRGPLFTARAMTAADTLPPGAPAGLQVAATNVSGSSLVLDWRAPADDDGSTVASYELRMATQAMTADTFGSGTLLTAPAPAAPGSAQHTLVTGLAPGTTYFGLLATDASGNRGPLATAQATLPAAGPAPPAFTVRAPGHEHPSGNRTASLRWGNLTGNPVFRGGVDQEANRTVTLLDPVVRSPLNVTGLADGTWYAHVAAFTPTGETQAPTLALAIDGTPPAAVADLIAVRVNGTRVLLQWSAPADAGGLAAYDLRWARGAALDDAGYANATKATGVPAPAATGTLQQVTLTLPANQTVAFALRSRDAAGNLAPLSNVAVATTQPDTTPPVGTPAITATGEAAFTWTPASDPDSSVAYLAAATHDDAPLPANRSALPHAIVTRDTNATFPGLDAGDWVLHVLPLSAGGAGSEARLRFHVGAVLDGEAVANANAGVLLNVTRTAAGNVLAWRLPAGLPAQVEGVRVWASNSPFTLVATLPAGSPNFAARTYTHVGAAAKPTTRYLVTLAFAGDGGPGAAPAVVLGTQGVAPAAVKATGIPPWLWAAVAGTVVLAAGAAVLLWLRRRKAAAPEPAAAPAPEPSAWGGFDALPPTEQVQCHACPTVFEVRGPRPVETVCTACGARGLLS